MVALFCTFFLQKGILALLFSLGLLVLTGRCVSSFMLPKSSLARIPFIWLHGIYEVLLISECLSLFSQLNSIRSWIFAQFVYHFFIVIFIKKIQEKNQHNISFRKEIFEWLLFLKQSPIFLCSLIVLFSLFLFNTLVGILSDITVWDTLAGYAVVAYKYLMQGSFFIDVPRQLGTAEDVYASMGWHKMYLYFMSLSGTTKFLNTLGGISTLMTFFSVVSSLQILGFSKKVTIAATLPIFCAPIAVVQSSNTNYDQQMAFTISMSVLFFILFLKNMSHKSLLLFFISLVMIAVTKLSILFIAPTIVLMMIVIIVISFRKQKCSGFFMMSITALIIGGLIFFPHFVRIFRAYGYILYPGQGTFVESFDEAKYILCARLTSLFAPFELSLIFPYDQISGFLEKIIREQILDWNYLKLRPNMYIKFKDMLLFSLKAYDHPDGMWYGITPFLSALCFVPILLFIRRICRLDLIILASFIFLFSSFYVLYARSFIWTPYNGRYVLMIWFTFAFFLAVIFRNMPNKILTPIVLVFFAFSFFEYQYVLTHDKIRPLRHVFNHTLGDQTVMLQYLKDNLKLSNSSLFIGKKLLDENSISKLYYDDPSIIMLYLDKDLKRKIILGANIDSNDDAQTAKLVMVPSPDKIAEKLDELSKRYFIVYIWEDYISEERFHALMVSRDGGKFTEEVEQRDYNPKFDLQISDLVSNVSLKSENMNAILGKNWGKQFKTFYSSVRVDLGMIKSSQIDFSMKGSKKLIFNTSIKISDVDIKKECRIVIIDINSESKKYELEKVETNLSIIFDARNGQNTLKFYLDKRICPNKVAGKIFISNFFFKPS